MSTSIVDGHALRPSSAHGAVSPPDQAAEPIQKTGARILCDALEQEGAEVLFGYPGGAIMPFYDALTASSLRHVLVRHAAGSRPRGRWLCPCHRPRGRVCRH